MSEKYVFTPTKTTDSLISPKPIEYEGDTPVGRFRIRLNQMKKYAQIWVIEPLDENLPFGRFIAPTPQKAINKLMIIIDYHEYCNELRAIREAS